MGIIWAIYHVDLCRAHRSLIVNVVVFGLVVIPPLFTWFNAAASRDPFGNTKGLRIAITNADVDYKPNLVPPRINIGNPVVSALRKNDNFDWVIDSEDAAIEGTRSDEYYAAIVIPSDFSCKILTFFDEGASSTPMTCYISEKKDGVSPEIAGQGAGAVSAQVSQIFVQTLSEVAPGAAASVGSALSTPTAVNAVTVLGNRVQTVASRLHTMADSADTYASLVGSSVTLIDSTATLVDGLRSMKGLTQSTVSGAQAGASDLGSAASAAISSVSDAISSSQFPLSSPSNAVKSVYANGSTSALDTAPTLRSQVSMLDTQATSFTSIKMTLGVLPGSPIFQSSLDRLQGAFGRLTKVASGLYAAASELDSKIVNTEARHTNVNGSIAQARSVVDGLSSDYETNLRPQLESLVPTLVSVQSSLSAARTSLEGAISTVSNGSGSAHEGPAQLCDNPMGAATNPHETAGKLDSLHASISEAFANGNLVALGVITGNNPEALAAAIAAPVGVERTSVYPVANFGSQMAPLYMILALWVSSILMVVSPRSDVMDSDVAEGLPGGHPLRATLTAKPIGLVTGHLGRYLTFGTIILTQVTLVRLGDLYFLKAWHAHPLQFMGTLWLTAVVLSFLLYTLIATFGNASKALGVLLLVLQISNAGRTLPLVILPSFFSPISPFLPTAHATTALRASIAGYAGHGYTDTMWFLASFTLFAVFLGLALHPLLVCKNRRMMEKPESTKLF